MAIKVDMPNRIRTSTYPKIRPPMAKPLPVNIPLHFLIFDKARCPKIIAGTFMPSIPRTILAIAREDVFDWELSVACV
jgi:hypothetical protein